MHGLPTPVPRRTWTFLDPPACIGLSVNMTGMPAGADPLKAVRYHSVKGRRKGTFNEQFARQLRRLVEYLSSMDGTMPARLPGG